MKKLRNGLGDFCHKKKVQIALSFLMDCNILPCVSSDIHFAGIAYEKIGDERREKSRDIYLRALKIEPDNFNALSQIANMAATDGNVCSIKI